MVDVYTFVSGPLAWAAFTICIGGCLYRLISLIVLAYKKERFIFTYMSFSYGLRSIVHWITPFATENWRRHPVLTVVTFAFHISLVIAPIFLLSHIVLWEEAWDLRWPALPDALADTMAVIVIAGCIFFLVRRLKLPEVQFVTTASDYVILAIVAAPFVTGFLAYHQWVAYPYMVIAHIISGEVMLVAIPFTRLSHMVFSPLTRAYMGSEFGKVRMARDW
ncbi:MAG: nitrate reductase [Deltaproteobacteria bacterium SG8_13]|nr:MAG: nitrate reductase [Deltaproteobacteria bacterium SG8_13]